MDDSTSFSDDSTAALADNDIDLDINEHIDLHEHFNLYFDINVDLDLDEHDFWRNG